MMGYLEESGITISDDLDDADVIVVNTCVVRKDSEERMIRRIMELRKIYGGSKKIVVAGCMVSSMPSTVKKIAPESSMISPQNIDKIVDVVSSPISKEYISGVKKIDKLTFPRLYRGVVAPVPISEGCMSDCSFCITKISRSTLRSYHPRVIVETIKDLVSRGFKEIELTSQDSAVYGFDLNDHGYRFMLPDLLNRVLEIEGDFMVRVGMMNPQWLDKIIDDLIEVYRHPKLYKFLHIPVQSGDNKVLKIMKRGYTVEEFEQYILEFRRKVPDITIATDIIVGHPGEDHHAFLNTLDMMARIRFDRVHIAQYSMRPLTEASRMPQVKEHIKKFRSKVAELLQEIIGYEINSSFIGRRAKVLMTERGFRRHTYVGRLMNYRPVVVRDALENDLGKWLYVEIDEATFFDLRGHRTV